MPTKVVSWSNPANDRTDYPNIPGFSSHIRWQDPVFKLGRVGMALDDSGWWLFVQNTSGGTIAAGTVAASNTTYLVSAGAGWTSNSDFANNEYGWVKSATKPI